MAKAVIVGSGAGASISALELAHAGWDVVVLEKGPNFYEHLFDGGQLRTAFSHDELKANRWFEQPDPIAEPRVWRPSAGAGEFVGDVNGLPTLVGGGTTHWDAKTPRFWDIDFAKLSMLGPVAGADIEDWPFTYAEIAPYYYDVEQLMGVQGEQSAIPVDPVLKHAPGRRGYVMPPGAQQFGSVLVAGGCTAVGMHPYPYPMAINSKVWDGRPICNDCSPCSGYGCPNTARIGALTVLRRAVRTGRVKVRDLTFVHDVVLNGRRATGVRWLTADGRSGVESADLVVLAASAIETVRLALLSDFPDPHDRIGRDIMFHNFVYGFGLYFGYRVHAYRGRASTHCCEDLADPAYPGAQAFAQANGLPYIRGGIMELGGTQDIIGEGTTYQFVLSILGNLPGVKPFGTNFKQLMRASLLRDRIAGITMAAEDLPYPTNRVDLSPRVRDYRGFPVARVTYQPGSFEKVSTDWVITQMTAVMKAAKADVAAAVPASLDKGNVPTGAHIMGGMRMGADPRRNVTDAWGMVHGLDNVLVSDGSVFPSSGAQNPTLTIMATALRNVRHLIGARTPGASHPGAVSGATPAGSGAQLPATGQDALTAALGTAAIGGGLALHRYTAGE